MVLKFSDGATGVFSPADEMLAAEGFLDLASTTLEMLPSDFPLQLFVESLVEAITSYH